MTSNQLKRIFTEASQIISGAERTVYLNSACENDSDLRVQVEKLLNVQSLAEGFLDQMVPPDLRKVPAACGPPDQVGPYRIVSMVGEGGMGIVYAAEQSEPVCRQVALKLIKPGMDSNAIIRRFESERQTLALMSHDNIARFLDAGTTEWQTPYFVMELVDGAPIIRYCDQRRLAVVDRLKLFIRVCKAVHHAHSKGIIHRDLKPANILIQEDDTGATPKVIDFGIAKAFDQQHVEQSPQTSIFQFIGTPEYMSPEQLGSSRNDVDTRCDIYSLGVLLFELLTGELPYRSNLRGEKNFDVLRKVVQESPVVRASHKVLALSNAESWQNSNSRQTTPRQLSLLLQDELDWILNKALEKDRFRRYESAAEFGNDLQRYLNNEAVRARPPSLSYRLRKFTSQHALALVALLLVFVAALTGTIVSIAFAIQANQSAQDATAAKRRAEASTRKAEAANAKAQELTYAADMRIASQSWKDGDISTFDEVLMNYLPGSGDSNRSELRGFEWSYLQGLTACKTQLLSQYIEPAYLARFGPKGHLVNAWYDGRIEFRRGPQFDLSAAFSAGRECVNGCDFDPSGRRLATIGDDGRVNIWNIEDQALILSFQAYRGHGHRVFFNAAGDTLATSGNDLFVRFWDATTGELVDVIDTRSHADKGLRMRLDCSSDRRLLAVGEDLVFASLYDFDSRRKIWDLAGSEDHRIACVRFSQDGKFVAAATEAHLILIWETQSARLSARLSGHHEDIQDLAFHPDGELLASCDRGGVVRVWSLQNEKNENSLFVETSWPRMIRAHRDRVYSIDFSPDGRQLCTAGRDGSVRIWSPADRDLFASEPRMNIESATILEDFQEFLVAADNRDVSESDVMSVSSDHHLFISCNFAQEQVRVWQLSNDLVRPVQEFENCTGGWLSPDGETLIIHRLNVAHAVDSRSGESKGHFEGHVNTVSAAVFSADGKLLVTGSHDRTVCVWDAKTTELLHMIRGHDGHITALAIHPDKRTIASGDMLGNVHLSHAKAGRLMVELNFVSEPIDDLRFSPDGKSLGISQSGRLRVLQPQF